MLNQLALTFFFFFIGIMQCYSQNKIGIDFTFGLRKNLIYASNDETSTPSNFSYSTDKYNTQFELLVSYRFRPRYSLSGGLGIANSAFYSNFKYSSNAGYLNAVYGSHIASLKVPIRIGYMLSPKFEILSGAAVNVHSLNEITFDSDYSFDQSIVRYYYLSDQKFEVFTTFSLNLGLQYYIKERFKLFCSGEMDLGKYPQTRTLTSIESSSPSIDIVDYYNKFSLRFYALTIGATYRILK